MVGSIDPGPTQWVFIGRLTEFMGAMLNTAMEQARIVVGDDQFDEFYRIGTAMGAGEAAAFALD